MRGRGIKICNLIFLLQLIVKKTKAIKLLVVYNQLHVVTLAQYINIIQQKALEKEVVKDIKEQMRKDKKWLKQL